MQIDSALSLVERSSAVVLDMCGTFMFGHDRFGPDETYGRAYRRLGGTALSDRSVYRAVSACFATMSSIYEDPTRQYSFPSVRSTLTSLPETVGYSFHELGLLEQVFANHEVGHIPKDYAETLRHLGQRRRLALVTDVWSSKSNYVEVLENAEVFDLFTVMVFSSDGCTVKPSRQLFDRAVSGLRVPPVEVLVIGDSLRRDIGGAQASGLKSIWIDSANSGVPEFGPHPGARISDLRDLRG